MFMRYYRSTEDSVFVSRTETEAADVVSAALKLDDALDMGVARLEPRKKCMFPRVKR
jgi:hypothetical protein